MRERERQRETESVCVFVSERETERERERVCVCVCERKREMYAHVHVCMCMCMYVCMCIYMYVCMCMYAFLFVCVCVCELYLCMMSCCERRCYSLLHKAACFVYQLSSVELELIFCVSPFKMRWKSRCPSGLLSRLLQQSDPTVCLERLQGSPRLPSPPPSTSHLANILTHTYIHTYTHTHIHTHTHTHYLCFLKRLYVIAHLFIHCEFSLPSLHVIHSHAHLACMLRGREQSAALCVPQAPNASMQLPSQ